jgi:CubicO group peptidase (beta-lactamase class C family)
MATADPLAPAAPIAVEADPAEAGFDPARLERIERHFAPFVDDGLLPGWLIAVSRGGRVVYTAMRGVRDLETGAPVEADTIWRIYSMTKPVTSVAAMMLWEEGAFELKDPVARFLPAFADARVWRGGSDLKPVTEPLTEPIRMWHLLTHTSGLTYGFHHAHPVDTLHRNQGFEWTTPPGLDLAGCCEAWARIPLLFQPGTEWNYGVSTDVLGRVIEVIEGRPLDEVLRARIFDPLGMRDTGFYVPEGQASRLAALYSPEPGTLRALRNDALGDLALRPPDCLQGGGGLVSTAADYQRFALMLRGRGDVGGVRLLGTRTVDYMAENHLPGGADLEAVGRPLFSETTFDGVGFGLGFSVTLDPVANRVLCSPGELAWGGAASTAFWVDPLEDVTALLFTQLLPSSTHPLRSRLRSLVYQALVD